MTSFPSRGLYVVTDRPRSGLLAAAEQALAGGARLLQYRDETTDRPRRHTEASALKQVCAMRCMTLLIDAGIELAHAVGADGVHLNAVADIAAARALLGADAIVGAACCGSLERARAAVAVGASYVSFGVFSRRRPSRWRHRFDRPVAPERHARRAAGGDWRHTPENGWPLIDAGADYLAAIAVFGTADPGATARRFANLFLSE